MQPGFQCSSKEVNNIMLSFIVKCSVHVVFCIAGTDIASPARNVFPTTGIPSDTKQRGLVFKFSAKTKSKKAKNLKP
jgi:hypothetical protein